MELRHLRYLTAIVELGSFAKAAALLSVPQPSLALHMRNLEASIGAELLTKGVDGEVTATALGEDLCRRAWPLVCKLDEVVRDVRLRSEATSV